MTALSFLCHLQRNLTWATQEQKQLSEKLKDETEQKEQLRRLKNEMENERWHLDKTIEKLQKEVREEEEGREQEWGREHKAESRWSTHLGWDRAPSEGLMKAKETCSYV